MTLQEYYESKGIDISEVNAKKEPVKKGEINAEWIKKEKLTVMETKEDKKQGSRNKIQVVRHQLQPGANVAEEEGAELLGFHGKQSKPRPERQERDDRNRDDKGQRERGGKKKEKVVINEE